MLILRMWFLREMPQPQAVYSGAAANVSEPPTSFARLAIPRNKRGSTAPAPRLERLQRMQNFLDRVADSPLATLTVPSFGHIRHRRERQREQEHSEQDGSETHGSPAFLGPLARLDYYSNW